MRLKPLVHFVSLISILGIFFAIVLRVVSVPVPVVLAQSCEEFSCDKEKQSEIDYSQCLADKQSCLEQKIGETQQQAITLANTISILNGQIAVQELQIQQTLAEIEKLEREIVELTDRIGGLDISLDQLSRIMVRRVGEQYKRSHLDPILILFSNRKLNGLISEYKYLKLTRQQTQDAMQRAEQQRQLYDEQKNLKEIKQLEIESKRRILEQQRQNLASKRAAQQQLLSETKNNEAKFQQELAKIRAEFEAIQAIIAGKGVETEVGLVNEGERIATIIQGASCNSSGAHLHFIVTKDGFAQSPFGYLKSGISYENCSGSSCGSGDSDPFNPSGSWEWPINPTIKMYQGYGATWAVRNTWVGKIYDFHNGIDINSGSTQVNAVKKGTLFRGSYSGSGGCRLRYVRVQHETDNISTLYLHINY